MLFIAVAFSVWGAAVVGYDPWRRQRVHSALVASTPWPDAILAAEGAAFPAGEEFVALCLAGDGPAAEFRRVSRGDYRLVQSGALDPNSKIARRIQTSDERFQSKSEWATAVRRLGQALRCESLTIIFPPTDAMRAELDRAGRLTAQAAVEF